MKNVEIFNSPMFGELRTSRNEKGEPIFCLKDVCDSLGLQVGAVVNRLNACHISSINVSKAKEDATPYISSINVGVKTGTKSDGTAVIQQIQMYFVTEPVSRFPSAPIRYAKPAGFSAKPRDFAYSSCGTPLMMTATMAKTKARQDSKSMRLTPLGDVGRVLPHSRPPCCRDKPNNIMCTRHSAIVHNRGVHKRRSPQKEKSTKGGVHKRRSPQKTQKTQKS